MSNLLDDLREANEEDALCFLWGGVDEVEVVEDEITDQGRWTTYHRAVLRRGDEFVAAEYGQGSTEMQENDEDVDFYVVVPVKVTTIKYEKV